MTIIDTFWVERNTNKPNGFIQGAIKYSNTSMGTFRFLQLINKVTKAWATVIKDVSPAIKTTQDVTGKGLDAFGLIAIPGDTVDGYQALVALTDKTSPLPMAQRVVNVVKDTGGAVATYHYAATLFTQNPAVAQVAKAFDFSSTVADLSNQVKNHAASQALLEKTENPAIKEAIHASKHYYFLSILKDVSSIGLFVISYLGLVCRALILAPAAMAFLSLAATIVAIKRDLYKTNMLYNLISFDRTVTVE